MASAYVSLLSLSSNIEQNEDILDFDDFKPLSAFLLEFFEEYHNSEICLQEILDLEIRTRDVAALLDYVINMLAKDCVLIEHGQSPFLLDYNEGLDTMKETFESIKEDAIKVTMIINKNKSQSRPRPSRLPAGPSRPAHVTSPSRSRSAPPGLSRCPPTVPSTPAHLTCPSRSRSAPPGLSRCPPTVPSRHASTGPPRQPPPGQSRHAPMGPSKPALTRVVNNNAIVGFDHHLIAVMERIMGHDSTLKILPIVGMGGIGKTILTQNVFEKKLFKDHFQIRLWSTISQSYKVQDIFSHFLHVLKIVDDQLNPSHLSFVSNQSLPSENELGDKLYKALFGRRYLIVLDDIWSVELWDTIGRFFPKNDNGSRIIITSRLLSVASYIGSYDPYKLEYLDEEQSWNLLERKVFGQDDCPFLLNDVGKRIAVSCRGLPLALVVIAGHLAKSELTKESWENIAGSLVSILVSRNDSPCLDILSLSYDNLPIHLKPCFLYLGLCREKFEFRVSKQVKLWITYGILKQTRDKCLEDTAMDYLTELVGRNLISVSKRGSSGEIKCFRIHDLLRDLCIRKIQEHQFLYWKITQTSCTRVSRESVVIPRYDCDFDFSEFPDGVFPDICHSCYRYIVFSSSQVMSSSISSFFAQAFLFQNLQTLEIQDTPKNEPVILPPEIWEWALLRNVDIKQVVMPDPPTAETHIIGNESCVLENLQTLQDVLCFKLSEEVVRRIPNLKKLKMTYTKSSDSTVEWEHYCLHNLARICKLESLRLSGCEFILPTDISFPQSLKKLTLDGCKLPWEEITMVGSLPNLEVLRLQNDAFCGREWSPTEGEFCRLKVLHLRNMSLAQWEADSSHFPRLERLMMYNAWKLKKIPLEIGDIATLQFISLENCGFSILHSLLELRDEQESMDNDSIQVDGLRCSIIDGNHIVLLKLLYLNSTDSLPPDFFHPMIEKFEGEVRELYAFLRYTANRIKQGNESTGMKELSNHIHEVFYEYANILLTVTNLQQNIRCESEKINYNLRRFLCVVKEIEYLSIRVQRIFLADGDYHHQELALYKDTPVVYHDLDMLDEYQAYRVWHMTVRGTMLRDPDFFKKKPYWVKYMEPPISNSKPDHVMFRDYALLSSIDGHSEENEILDSPIHVGISCDYCGKKPIVGVRYKCNDCTEDGGFDLCEECYSSGLVSDHTGMHNNQKHTSEHEFEIQAVNLRRIPPGYLKSPYEKGTNSNL